MDKTNEVDAFFAKLAHPLKAEMMRVREIIMGANSALTEKVQWGGPSFEFGEALATFNPRVKECVALIFHSGERFVQAFPFLEPGPKGRAYAKFRSLAEVEQHRADLCAIVDAFVGKRGGA